MAHNHDTGTTKEAATKDGTALGSDQALAPVRYRTPSKKGLGTKYRKQRGRLTTSYKTQLHLATTKVG